MATMIKMPGKIKLCIVLLCFCGYSCIGQKKNISATTAGNQSIDSVFYSVVHYRQIGPFRGGRSGAVTGSYKNKNSFYFGSTGGGVWKTTDGGVNWKNISDKHFGGTIGAIAVAPSDESVIYTGEGENTLRGNVSEGLDGLWRSNDGGRSWKNAGLKEARHIIRIIVDPRNPDIVWVAAIGHLFGPNTDRGVFKTTDGGKTWKKTLFVNDNTGCSDLVMEPGNPAVFYAGMWQVRRTPYSMESGGDGSGLYKSTDGGETWKNLTTKKGLPAGIWGIVGLAVAPSNTDKVFALIENSKGGLFISDDGGETWILDCADNNIRQRAWYYSKVYVDPKNENIVYCPNVEFMRSLDGGKSFKSIFTPHGDHHDLWIDPEDGRRMIVADDGGAQVSFDAANSWSTLDNQPTAQIYRVTTDNAFPYHILGAQQDNSTIRIKSRTDDAAGINDGAWEATAGAESGYVVADPLNPEIVYGGNYGGYIGRLDHKTGENRAINVWPDNPMGAGADVQKFRFQWNFPIFFSPNSPKRLYVGGNHLFVTENQGQSWETISPDLTTNDKTKQVSSGGPITKDNTGVEYYCTIFTAAESSLEKDLLWTGSDDGLVYMSKDAGKIWNNVTPPAAGKWMMWNCIETDPFKKGTAYIVGTRYKMDDYTPYIYVTEDYGNTWKLITEGIEKMHFARVVRADKKRPGLLYAGTEYGMYISYNGGQHWSTFQLNLPIVPVTDLTIKNNDLIIATQGRAFWAIDDLSILQQKTGMLPAGNLKVFAVNDTYRPNGYPSERPAKKIIVHNAGDNPLNGVVFNYFIKAAADSDHFTITIFDKQNIPIRTFTNKSADIINQVDVHSGMNQFSWNMLYSAADKAEGMILWNGGVGPVKAAPGKYTARFKMDKDSADVSFIIKANPTYDLSQEDYDNQVSFLLQLRDKFNEIQKAIKNIRSLRSQITEFSGRLDSVQDKQIKNMADSIVQRMTLVEEALYQTKAKSGQDVLNFPIRLNDKIAGLYSVASSGENPPSQQLKDAFKDLGAQSDTQLNKFKKILTEDVPAFNKMLLASQVPLIGVKQE
jgi:photosystem II stability/assembly factor-like uncharacterized protein